MRVPIRALERGLQLLGLFDADHAEWTLKEMRERTGLPKATVRRLMITLEASDWVVRDEGSGTYRVGPGATRIGYAARSHNELVRIAHPHLVRLADETTESVSFSVWTRRGAMLLDNVSSLRMFRYGVHNGMLLEGLTSANAKALVAFLPEQMWDGLLSAPIEARTSRTVTDPERVREQWQQYRDAGVAFDWGEWTDEAMATGAPVLDRNGVVLASVSVVVPVERATEETMRRCAAAAMKTAGEISRQLG
jgi:DNA-binding IclR family transcriptional regulator